MIIGIFLIFAFLLGRGVANSAAYDGATGWLAFAVVALLGLLIEVSVHYADRQH